MNYKISPQLSKFILIVTKAIKYVKNYKSTFKIPAILPKWIKRKASIFILIVTKTIGSSMNVKIVKVT